MNMYNFFKNILFSMLALSPCVLTGASTPVLAEAGASITSGMAALSVADEPKKEGKAAEKISGKLDLSSPLKTIIDSGFLLALLQNPKMRAFLDQPNLSYTGCPYYLIHDTDACTEFLKFVVPVDHVGVALAQLSVDDCLVLYDYFRSTIKDDDRFLRYCGLLFGNSICKKQLEEAFSVAHAIRCHVDHLQKQSGEPKNMSSPCVLMRAEEAAGKKLEEKIRALVWRRGFNLKAWGLFNYYPFDKALYVDDGYALRPLLSAARRDGILAEVLSTYHFSLIENHGSFTLLQRACLRGQMRNVQEILAVARLYGLSIESLISMPVKGDPDGKYFGKTALDLANMQGYWDIIDLLCSLEVGCFNTRETEVDIASVSRAY